MGEFGWDPASWLYVLQEWTWEWYGWLTVPLVPFWHYIGASDTGCLFAILWWCKFPDAGPGGKCDKQFYKKWLPVRVKYVIWTTFLWSCVRSFRALRFQELSSTGLLISSAR